MQSALIKQVFVENGYDIPNSALFRTCELTSTTTGDAFSAYTMTVREGNYETTMVLAEFGEKDSYTGEYQPIDAMEVLASGTVRRSTAKYVISATASYKHYTSGSNFYQPQGCSFVCSLKDEDADVSHVAVHYFCPGEKHTYPGFAATGVEVENVISLSKVDPVSGTYYNKSSPYSSGYCIRVYNYMAQNINITVTVDNTTNTYVGCTW